MPPHTPPSCCPDCQSKDNKISHLEERISILHRIRQEEDIMNSLVISSVPAPSSPGSELDSDIVQIGGAAATNISAALANTVLDSPPSSPRSAQIERPDARRNTLASSTPGQRSWTSAGRGKHGGKLLTRPSGLKHAPAPTLNMFSCLNVESLPHASTSCLPSALTLPPPHRLHSPLIRPGQFVFTPTPIISTLSSAPHSNSLAHSPDDSSLSPPLPIPSSSSPTSTVSSAPSLPPPAPPPPLPVPSPTSPPSISTSPPPPLPVPPLFSPSVLIIGDSITRNITFVNGITRYFPGATTITIIKELPSVLLSLPSSITKIVLHIGSNDVNLQNSELTKENFRLLFNILKKTGKIIFISGPTPSFRRGVNKFSRLLSLHTWLMSVCPVHNFTFIHNFNLFWERVSFFARDGLHPNTLGVEMLRANFHHAAVSQADQAAIIKTAMSPPL